MFLTPFIDLYATLFRLVSRELGIDFLALESSYLIESYWAFACYSMRYCACALFSFSRMSLAPTLTVPPETARILAGLCVCDWEKFCV